MNDPRALRLWLALLLGMTALDWGLHRNWRDAPGWELEMIGQSLADGRGFSFPAEDRWLFAPESSIVVYPTAWREPAYPALIGSAFAVLGADWGRQAVAASQALMLVLTACALAWLGSIVFDRPTGLLAGLALALLPAARGLARGSLDNSLPAALLICVIALLLLRGRGHASRARGLALGTLLGASALVHAGTLVYLPLAVAFVALDRASATPRRTGSIAAMVLAAAVVLTPWTLRNWRVFHQVVPIRTGFGWNAYLGNPTLAATYAPEVEACASGAPPPWTRPDGFEAISFSMTPANRVALYDWQRWCVDQTPPPGYARMNEAQRDALYARGALMFVAQHPGTALGLWARRLVVYLFPEDDPMQGVVSGLAALGVALSLRRRDARLLLLLGAGYALPYVLCSIFYYRYRYPIEPLLLLFASHAVWSLLPSGLRARLGMGTRAPVTAA